MSRGQHIEAPACSSDNDHCTHHSSPGSSGVISENDDISQPTEHGVVVVERTVTAGLRSCHESLRSISPIPIVTEDGSTFIVEVGIMVCCLLSGLIDSFDLRFIQEHWLHCDHLHKVIFCL